MTEDIYDPLTEYINVFKDRFKEVADRTFAELAQEANVDVQVNQETCRKIYAGQRTLDSLKSHLSWWRFTCFLLWAGVIAGSLYLFMYYRQLAPEVLIPVGVGCALALLFLFLKVHPQIREMKGDSDIVSSEIGRRQKEAWQQMEPLNRLYDWDTLTRMMAKTVPRLEFDPYFTTQRLADLQQTYGWDGSFNAERSVLFSHSGLINGNPFVICRTRKMEMGKKTYHGSKTIYWTTTEYGSNGERRTVQHSETLTASVTAPFPEYFEKTRLIYGNTAAPDLEFCRIPNGLAGKEGTLKYKWARWRLRKKARDLKNHDFAMLTNEDFEVVFDTRDRNNNQQFALLFTPLAQENMLKLLRDSTTAFGDDFSFEKLRKINIIVPEHLQDPQLDLNPYQYHSFDYVEAQQKFQDISQDAFRAIYFSLAPLLCVPMYQQIRSQENIYGHDMEQHSAFWEHEALANFWGQDYFQHPQCATPCILKTEECRQEDGSSMIHVHAHGYRIEKRISYISRYGGDGRWHDVPVYWDEYLPVEGLGQIEMREDAVVQKEVSQSERIHHIDKVLQASHLSVYRRHIASKV